MRQDRAVESVWDYPRPPRVEPTDEHVLVEFAGVAVADTGRALRVLETSQPPAYYVPPDDVAPGVLEPHPIRTFCEWKGVAVYWTLVVDGRRVEAAAWSYPEPTKPFEVLRHHLAFYPSRVDACFLDEEKVRAQEGDFYGGWITSRVRGPFKGGPGTQGW
ncbi:MAG: DUF427 domain-containing protein [Acidimicrobiia bacterium]